MIKGACYIVILHAIVVIVHFQPISTESLCECGFGNCTDKGSLACVKWDDNGISDTIVNSIYETRQETCLNYSVQYHGSSFSCKMDNYSLHDLCEVTDDGSLFCVIKSPNYSLNQCYPSQMYCVHSVVCPVDSALYFYNSKMELTANINGSFDCTDMVEVEESYYNYIVHSNCGSTCVPSFTSTEPLLVQFASSQCCQNFGYLMYALCVPIHDIANYNRGTLQQAISLLNRVKRNLPQRVENKIILNLGSILQYKHYTITISKQKETIAKFNKIKALYVYNKHQKDLRIFHGSYERNLYGYGALVVSGNEAHYLALGLPDEYLPTQNEKDFIHRSLDFLTPYYTLKGGYPSLDQKLSVLEDVIHYRKKSKNPFVSSTANLMSQFLLDHECKEIDIESNPNENDSSEVLKTIK